MCGCVLWLGFSSLVVCLIVGTVFVLAWAEMRRVALGCVGWFFYCGFAACYMGYLCRFAVCVV